MIHVICNIENSVIKLLEVSGHSCGGKNDVIICAAVSCLSRTVCEIVTRMNGVSSDCKASAPGDVVLSLHNYKKIDRDRLFGITDFLIFGMIGIKRDYPESIKLNINNKEWYDGSQKRWW